MESGIIIALIGLAGIVLGSGAATAIVQAVIATRQKKYEKKDETARRLEDLEEKALKAEKDSVRLQLLILISDYPDDTAEILTAAKHYFGELKADWYLTSIFNRYLEERSIGKPDWFDV